MCRSRAFTPDRLIWKGKHVVVPRFEWAYEFHQGLGAVREGKKWGLLNPKGEWVKTPIDDRLDPLVGGRYAEAPDRRKGFLDEKCDFRP